MLRRQLPAPAGAASSCVRHRSSSCWTLYKQAQPPALLHQHLHAQLQFSYLHVCITAAAELTPPQALLVHAAAETLLSSV